MAGRILEFTADKSFEDGKTIGIEIGKETLVNELDEIIHGFKVEVIPASTVLRLIHDKKFRKKMYEELKNNNSQVLAGNKIENI